MDDKCFIELKDLIVDSLKEFYDKDSLLLEYKSEDAAVCERSMVFHIGSYIKGKLSNTPFASLNVDVEYNRNFNHPKGMYSEIYEKHKNTYPDLIIHKRRSNNDNTLVIEFKKHGNSEKTGRMEDREKLEFFTNPNEVYRFKYGFWIVLHRKKAIVHVYSEGKELAHLCWTESFE